MVKHIVFTKLKDNSKENKAKLMEVFMSMKDKVPQIIDIKTGADFVESERSYDVALEVVVKDRQALTDYTNDEYHCSVVKKYVHENRIASVIVDYEY
ncbi:MAG TPA: Dabb family protein [Clostridia bacterium]|nr:Dabb family protein [Clostridia bacterium]